MVGVTGDQLAIGHPLPFQVGRVEILPFQPGKALPCEFWERGRAEVPRINRCEERR